MFQERAVITHKATRELYRVVWAVPGRTWIMPLDDGSRAWPIILPEADCDRYELCAEPAPSPVSPAGFKHAQEVYQRFGGVLAHLPGLLTSTDRAQAFQLLKQQDPSVSSSTFYKVARRWLRGGAVVSALAPLWKGSRKPLDIADIDSIGYAEAVATCRRQSERLMREPQASEVNGDHTNSGQPRKRYAINRPTRFVVDRQALRVFHEFYRRKLATAGKSLPVSRFSRRPLLRAARCSGQPGLSPPSPNSSIGTTG